MKITLCGSAGFIDDMEQLAHELESLGHEVKLPPVSVIDKNGKEFHTRDYYKLKKTMPTNPAFWREHTQRIRNHMDKIAGAEAVLVTNYDKNGIKSYIGPNTLMEMGIAFYLHKKIFLLNPIPEVAWKEEILGMQPVVLKGDFKLIA